MLALALVNDLLTRGGIEAVTKSSAHATRYLEASMHNAEVAQTLGMTDALLARWRERSAEASALQRPVARRTSALAALTRMVRQSVQVLLLALGAWLVIRGEATAGVMIATTVLLGRALAPVEQVVGSWRVLAEGRAAYRRLVELLDAHAAQPEPMALPAPRGRLCAQNLVYRAPQGQRLILAGVSLQLEPGEAMALIGPSGAGKSTLMRLLTGVWQPTQGTVRLDDSDLSQWPRGQIGPHIGYVPQDVELFPGTVAENIARQGAVDPAKVVQAAQRAHVHEMILSLPNGYDTLIVPDAALLSPGQRQRIALARALYGDPKLVFLDEPNANLDGAGEQALADTLKDLRGKATVVVVTHRNTLIRHVDKMLVLEAGRVPTSARRAMSSSCCSRAPTACRSGRRRRTRGGTPAPGGPRRDAGHDRRLSMSSAARMDAAAWSQGAVDAPVQQQLDEARRLARWAAIVVVGGLLPILAWLCLAPLASAVVASAFVKVDLDRRPVQHAEGGTVREVLVRDGQRVRQGEPLLVLGDVSVAADLNRLDYRVMAERASIARLEAEQAAARTLRFPDDVTVAASTDPRLAEQMAKEKALFDARRDALTGQVSLLRAQHAKVLQEAQALRAQIAQASESLRHQAAELETNRNLLKDGFVSATRIAQLEAGVADYRAKVEERRSELARAEQRAVETDLRVKSLESEYGQQASDQLKVTLQRLAEIQQEQRKTTDAATRQVIVAPATGDVINLKFTSPGAMVAPREPIADIVPADPRLVVEAHIRTEDVSRVRNGQHADIRFTAFKYRTTHLVAGKVFYVSPDRLLDPATGQPYYVALIEADADSLGKAAEVRLQAGMPAEVYVRGEERTPLQYLAEPITQVLRRAGREQ